MSDYNLINKLLEDGSESSLLKLKMIVSDLDCFNDSEIHYKNRHILVGLFKEYYETAIEQHPLYYIRCLNFGKNQKIVEMFPNIDWEINN